MRGGGRRGERRGREERVSGGGGREGEAREGERGE